MGAHEGMTLAKYSILSRVTTWQVKCSYVHFNASVKAGTWGLVRIGADKRTTSVSPSAAWYWLRWNSGPTTCCVRVRVCRGGYGRVLLRFVPNRCGLFHTIYLTAGEVVLTTYMGVALFLERPALPSAPRPQTIPSSCTTLQLRKGNRICTVEIYRQTQLCQEQVVSIARIRVLYNSHWLTHPTTTAAVEESLLQVPLCFYTSTSVSCDVFLLRLQKLFIRSSDWRRAHREAQALYQN